MNKLLTIVIPTYNMQEYLHRCLDSLILNDETLMNQLEVLVINDGSKDNSSAIAHEYESKYPDTFRVIDKENGNYGSCVNRGLKEAVGKYFRILDADDFFNLSALQQLLIMLQTNDADVIFTRCVNRDVDGHILKDEPFHSSIILHTLISANDFNTIRLGCWPFSMHTMTYKTSVLRDANLVLSEGISYTDNEFIYYPLEKVNTLWFEDIALYQYTVGREGQTMTPALMQKSVGHFDIILTRMLEHYDKIKPQLPLATLVNMQGIIFSMMHWMYSLLLNSPKTGTSNTMLIKLDSIVNNHEEFSDRVSTIERYGFRYVDYWHRTGRTCVHPVVQIYLQWNRFLKILKRYVK